MKSFSTKELKNKRKMNRHRTSANKRYINGRLLTPSGESYNIANAARLLKKKKAFPTNVNKNDDITTSLAVLAALGVTATRGSKAARTTSFRKREEGYVRLSNPNLPVSDKLKKLKNKKVKTTNMFRSLKNPFYVLDDPPSDNYLYSSIPTDFGPDRTFHCKTLASNIFNINIINRRSPTIREFK